MKTQKKTLKGAGKAMLETLFCIVVNFTTILDKMTIRQIYELVKSDKLKSVTIDYRKLVKSGKLNEAKETKKSLSGFTPSGVCEGGRTAKHFVTYSSCIMLDFDNIPMHLLKEAIKSANECEYTLFSFVSVSGCGLKILVRVNSAIEHHETACKQVLVYYEKLLSLKGDSATKDLPRLCFLSHDPLAFINEGASIFKIEIAEPSFDTVTSDDALDKETKLFDYAVKYTSNKIELIPGQRNNFLHLLANNCNKYALPKESVVQLAISRLKLDLPEAEIKTTVKNVYSRNAQEFGSWSKQKKQNTVATQLTLEGIETILRKVMSEFIHPINQK